MNRKRIAVISSYHEECGAAFYSSRLKRHLAEHADVEILRLDVGLLRNRNRRVVKKANRHIAEIARRMKDFDGVCLQFEPGLYAARPKWAYRRVLRLCRAHHNVVLTVHGFERPPDFDLISLAASLFSFSPRRIAKTMRFLKQHFSYRHAVRFWHRLERLKDVRILTFCKADAKLLKIFFGLTRVYDFPITYYTQEEVEAIRRSCNRSELLRRYGLNPAKKYVGIFGFLSNYKGHLTAIKMLEYLPEDYHLIIVGGEHPHGLEPDLPIGKYLQQILYFAEKGGERTVPLAAAIMEAKRPVLAPGVERVFGDSPYAIFLPSGRLTSRVHFLGQLPDEEIARLHTAVDYVVLPYMLTATGQSGSGPGTLAVEFGTRAVFSNVPVFREMARYFRGIMRFANVGNHIEFAHAVLDYDLQPPDPEARHAALSKYNPRNMAATYLQLLGFENLQVKQDRVPEKTF